MKNASRSLLTPLACSLALIPSSAAAVSDWYVDAASTQCSAADGSPALPFCSISEALSVAMDGDTVLIAPGVYEEELTVDQDIELIGLGGRDEVMVDGGGVFGRTALEVPLGADVRVEGVTLQNFENSAYVPAGLSVRGALTLVDSAVVNMRGQLEVEDVEPGPNRIIGGTFRAERTVIRDCRGHLGAGLYARDASVELVDSSVLQNNAYDRGGGLFLSSTTTVVMNSTIAYNSASGQASGGNAGYGGGVEVQYGSARFERSTLSINQATLGGAALYAISFTPMTIVEMESCTVFGHSSAFGTIGADSGSPGAVVLRNCWVGSPSAASPQLREGVTSGGHNLIDSYNPSEFTPDASDVLVASATLAPLANRGGPTLTHALLVGDAGIDLANPATQPALDQRGVPVEGAGGDIGAVEATSPGTDGGCQAAPNSTGQISVTDVQGSAVVNANVMRLSTAGLPAGVVGYYISGSTTGLVVGAGGGQGTLCLGGEVGRFLVPPAGGILLVPANGAIGLDIDLAQFPSPGGASPLQPGERRVFQFWHRDANPQATSNFSSSAIVDFR